WVVHDLRFTNPIEGLGRRGRSGPMEEMLYAADPLWNDPARYSYDPKRWAWVEVADPNSLARFHPGGPAAASEAVTVRYPSPERAELDVTLDRPGVVVLADALYPGWTLTVDDKPATIIRTNRMMRGAAVEAGKHGLVYEYRPPSFAIGKVVSLIGFVGLLASLLWSAGWTIRPVGLPKSTIDL
ncbi:MAG TPA: YfhO family protein, partial [Isosphaeraceae bacterium]